jgi:hypothetical protein
MAENLQKTLGDGGRQTGANSRKRRMTGNETTRKTGRKDTPQCGVRGIFVKNREVFGRLK